MLKELKYAALALLVATGFTACSDDEGTAPVQPTPVPSDSTQVPGDSTQVPGDSTQAVRGEKGFYVINQGSQGTIDGTISFVSFAEGAVNNVNDEFRLINNQSLGDSPQKAIIYGSKMYVPVYGSNTLWVLDAATLKIIKQVTTNQPEGVCASNGYVFVSNNDGYVTRVDTTAYNASTPLAVGPNPAELTAVNGKVYVSISDGYNYANNYANGYKVAVINASSFTKEKDITVGMNPGGITSDILGNVFVVCRGNYSDVASKVWKISASTGEAAEFADGSLIATISQERNSRATAKADVIYVLNVQSDYSHWPEVTTVVNGAAYNTVSGAKVVENFIPTDHTPASPTAIDVNPYDGLIYISTQATAAGYTDPGYVMVFNGNGTFVKQYNTGVEPFGVVFK